VNIEQCDAQSLVESVIDAAKTHLPDGVSVQLDPVENGFPPVAADPGQLRQVIGNVIDNAIKYSPDGGDVHVRLEHSEGVVRFAIADRGLGIPPRERERIFEKFYRLDPDMAHGIGGTGLGLYISRELVRGVNGRIWVEPNGARGSVFYIELPAVLGSAVAKSPRGRASASA
jgi:two-component system, OmpR family, sensor histidine kinase VicK